MEWKLLSDVQFYNYSVKEREVKLNLKKWSGLPQVQREDRKFLLATVSPMELERFPVSGTRTAFLPWAVIDSLN